MSLILGGGKATRPPRGGEVITGLAFCRRAFLLGAGASALTACGGGSSSKPSTPATPAAGGTPTPTPTPSTAPGVVAVSQFYSGDHGNNLQPAFQGAIDYAGKNRLPKVINDLGPKRGEMWTPRRISPPGLQADGIPLVIRSAIELDFAGIHLDLKGPEGGPRMEGQQVAGFAKPWLGGWLYVLGNPTLETVAVLNVSVDGHYEGDFSANTDANLSDKGFRVQDTVLGKVVLTNVELRNFGGEIYYIGGHGPHEQELTDCHFHGSPQSAFNPGGLGLLRATRLQAGRAYQVAEVLGGAGHEYRQGRFYDSGRGGASFFGGPAPRFPEGFPYWYSYWDGVGEPPWIRFENSRFENIDFVNLGSWIRGLISAQDAPIWTFPRVGHLRSIDLEIDAVAHRKRGIEAVGIHGIEAEKIQVPGCPIGTWYQRPSDIGIRLRCGRSMEAMQTNLHFQTGMRFYGTLIDSATARLSVSGNAHSAIEIFQRRTGFTLPNVDMTGFSTV